ncbi:MAG: hypothetical protein LWX11_06035 [Firmicutes bacterium]|nr:hypothetical protein [Bacillota bacterium]
MMLLGSIGAELGSVVKAPCCCEESQDCGCETPCAPQPRHSPTGTATLQTQAVTTPARPSQASARSEARPWPASFALTFPRRIAIALPAQALGRESLEAPPPKDLQTLERCFRI